MDLMTAETILMKSMSHVLTVRVTAPVEFVLKTPSSAKTRSVSTTPSFAMETMIVVTSQMKPSVTSMNVLLDSLVLNSVKIFPLDTNALVSQDSNPLKEEDCVKMLTNVLSLDLVVNSAEILMGLTPVHAPLTSFPMQTDIHV